MKNGLFNLFQKFVLIVSTPNIYEYTYFHSLDYIIEVSKSQIVKLILYRYKQNATLKMLKFSNSLYSTLD